MGQNNLSSTSFLTLLIQSYLYLAKRGVVITVSEVLNYYATDYMLGTILLVNHSLFINTFYLYKAPRALDASKVRSYSCLLNSQSSDLAVGNIATNIQSAENCKGFSETVRRLPGTEDYKFWSWFAGIIDGDGNFDIRKSTESLARKPILKSIRIKLHNRDVRILTRIQNYLHFGTVITFKNKPFSIYSVYKNEDKIFLINKLNGLIRIKSDSFKKACSIYNIEHIEPNYNISAYDPYFAGLIDTDGSIVFNYNSNRIECNLEFKYNEYTRKLNLDNVIPYYKPSVGLKKSHYSIAFKYQTVNGMVFLYDYFMKNRLYSDFKFYRVSKIKRFIVVRDYKNKPKDSMEFKIYSDFILDWIQYRNPLWHKVPFVKKIR